MIERPLGSKRRVGLVGEAAVGELVKAPDMTHLMKGSW
jgi:hypothetical protein